MAYDDGLAERVRDVLALREEVVERKMFGGLAWMVGGNMACGVSGDELLVRLGDEAERALKEPHTHPFNPGKPGRKPMGGFVCVNAEGYAEDAELAGWIDAGFAYAASLPPK